MKKKSEKQKDLDNLKTELARVSTVILTTFQGITVENDTKLRREVQKAGGKYQVVKTDADIADTKHPIAAGLKPFPARDEFYYKLWLADGARPNNVLGGIPTIATDYSPIWDAQLFEWTQNAITQGFRGQVREEFQILTFVQDGLITGPGGGKLGSSGFSINCPIAQRLN